MFVTGNKQTVDEIENPVTKIGHCKFLDSFYLKLNKHIGEEIENAASKTGRSNFKLMFILTCTNALFLKYFLAKDHCCDDI